MTSYWDEKSRQVSEACQTSKNFDVKVGKIADIEKEAIALVSADITDTEMPSAHKLRLHRIVDARSVLNADGSTNITNATRAVTACMSWLIEDLHSAYHKLAQDRPLTRWGSFCDSPSQNCKSRDEFDEVEGD